MASTLADSRPAVASPSDGRVDAIARSLWAAGFQRRLYSRGLFLWRLDPAATRGGERLFLTVSLPPDDTVLDREVELERRLAESERSIVTEIASILGMPEDRVALSAASLESCCGAGCAPCLLPNEMKTQRREP